LPVGAGKPIIGLAGGIASGKTTVATILADLGAAVINADQINHEELNDPDVLDRLKQWWGHAVISPDGRADRDAIRQFVGNDPTQRRRLEQLVHPRIARRSESLIARYQSDPDVRAIIWDAPLLYEVGLAERCDFVIFVETDRQARLERVRQRGWSENDLERFEGSQEPLEAKKRRADYVVRGDGDLQALRGEVEKVLSTILARS
jgi:dephospho-CoA kinase